MQPYYHTISVKDIQYSYLDNLPPPYMAALTVEVHDTATPLTLRCSAEQPAIGAFSEKQSPSHRFYTVLFSLFNFAYEKVQLTSERKKSISPLNNALRYRITGQVVRIQPSRHYADSFAAIVDCGIHVSIRIAKSIPVSVGDSVSTDGRLDIIEAKMSAT